MQLLFEGGDYSRWRLIEEILYEHIHYSHVIAQLNYLQGAFNGRAP